MLAFVFTALHPGLKGGLEACRRGDTKISKEQAELLRFLPADARGIKNTEDPDRGEESPLHIQDRARCTAGCVLEGVGLEPPREVGHVPYRQEIAKGREDVVSSEEGLVSRRAWEARRSGVEGSQKAGNVEERGRGARGARQWNQEGRRVGGEQGGRLQRRREGWRARRWGTSNGTQDGPKGKFDPDLGSDGTKVAHPWTSEGFVGEDHADPGWKRREPGRGLARSVNVDPTSLANRKEKVFAGEEIDSERAGPVTLKVGIGLKGGSHGRDVHNRLIDLLDPVV